MRIASEVLRPQTVGELATAVIDIYLESGGYFYGPQGRSAQPGFDECWKARAEAAQRASSDVRAHASSSAETNSRVPGGPVSSREIGPPSGSTVMLKRRKRQHWRSASIVRAMVESMSSVAANRRRWPCGSSSWACARRSSSDSSPSRRAFNATCQCANDGQIRHASTPIVAAAVVRPSVTIDSCAAICARDHRCVADNQRIWRCEPGRARVVHRQ
jgi:hypothetical protein